MLGLGSHDSTAARTEPCCESARSGRREHLPFCRWAARRAPRLETRIDLTCAIESWHGLSRMDASRSRCVRVMVVLTDAPFREKPPRLSRMDALGARSEINAPLRDNRGAFLERVCCVDFAISRLKKKIIQCFFSLFENDAFFCILTQITKRTRLSVA